MSYLTEHERLMAEAATERGDSHRDAYLHCVANAALEKFRDRTAPAVDALVKAVIEYEREANIPLAATDLMLRKQRRDAMFAALKALDAAAQG